MTSLGKKIIRVGERQGSFGELPGHGYGNGPAQGLGQGGRFGNARRGQGGPPPAWMVQGCRRSPVPTATCVRLSRAACGRADVQKAARSSSTELQ